ncbi:hypothetical protein pdam_00004799 [Pocillopora damicornis]|uniref:Uncharacterized protein n=1 Tax=Pocillopora damicornis TaxID=46731 RepID=A0A3M6U9B4_POCDA|nr:hypothetical protein pdam_00004799 [Pocillopora damicornis]
MRTLGSSLEITMKRVRNDTANEDELDDINSLGNLSNDACKNEHSDDVTVKPFLSMVMSRVLHLICFGLKQHTEFEFFPPITYNCPPHTVAL